MKLSLVVLFVVASSFSGPTVAADSGQEVQSTSTQAKQQVQDSDKKEVPDGADTPKDRKGEGDDEDCS